MKRTRTFLALAAGAVLLAGGVSAAAFAGPHHRFGGFGSGLRWLGMAESLDLSEEQEVAVVRMRRAIREEAKQNREAIRSSFDDVLLELEKAQPDAARLHQLVDQTTAQMNKVAHSSVDQFLKFHSTLTPQQRQQLVDNARLKKERIQQFRDGKQQQKKK